jgi:ribonuclease HI
VAQGASPSTSLASPFLGAQRHLPIASSHVPASGLVGAAFGFRDSCGWPSAGRVWWPPPPTNPGRGNCTWATRSCRRCGGTVAELRALRPLLRGEPLFVDRAHPAICHDGDPPSLVLTFDGSAAPGGPSGAAAILWGSPSAEGIRPQLIAHSSRIPSGSVLSAEVAGFLEATRLLAGRAPTSLLIAGDNPRVMQVLSTWGRFRCAELQPLLLGAISAIHAAGWRPSFQRLPRCQNREADRLARLARSAAVIPLGSAVPALPPSPCDVPPLLGAPL